MNAAIKIHLRSSLALRIFAQMIFGASLFFSSNAIIYCQSAEPISPTKIISSRSVHGINVSSRQITSIRYLPKIQSAITPVYKTSGKEFYCMFLASVGTDNTSDPSLRRIYISARSRIHGTISLVKGAWSQSFTTTAKGLIAIDLPDWAEMTSVESEVLLPKVFNIQAEDEIAVYGLSHKWLSTDGFLILPVEALGSNYTIASVRNALYYFGGEVNQFSPNNINPRSELGIAAISDNTTVTVTLNTDSYNRKFLRGIPYTFTMNAGEAIQIMSHDTAQTGMYNGALSWIGPLANGIDCDLTGSTITSDKPIAVFSGHERASIPDSLEYVYKNHPSVSRDHLIEQMPPQENWGKHFVIVASLQDDYGNRPKTGDIIRVIAATDSTVILVNGKQQSKINKGSYVQFSVTKLAYIETSQPALVVKYLRTALPDSAAPGDPDLTVIPPLENMSMFYSLPTAAVGYDFTDHFITILADSLALNSTTLNGFTLDSKNFASIPGTRYYYATQRTYPGSQRVESTMPCYAETYGYGIFDSYSFTGGGSFKYLHDLVAKDLDFGKISTGDIKDSLTGVQSISVPMPLGDSITIYGYSWESGDTNSFALLDTITKQFTIPPGFLLHVNFKFHPITDGKFSAKLHVWSSNTDDVFINVYGQSGSPKIVVSPDTINFGRVRIGKIVDSNFLITDTGDVSLNLTNSNFNSFLKAPFFADPYSGDLIIFPGNLNNHGSVHFAPVTRNYFSGNIPIRNSTNQTPIVLLLGRGVNFEISSSNKYFGKTRVGKSSDTSRIAIINSGDDSTSIVSISLTAAGNPQDFYISTDSLPALQPKYWLLDTLKSNANTKYYKAVFSPKLDTAINIIDTGLRFAVVKIITTDGNIYYDTLSGIGAEPWLIATIPVLDFGIITNPLVSSPATLSFFDTLYNKGTMIGILDSLRHTDPSFFMLRPSSPLIISDGTTIQENNTIPFAIDFSVKQIGDFIDTIYAYNDSRHQPVVIAKASVRAGIAPLPPDSLGIISSCLPIDTTIIIHNPYRVNVKINSFRFEGDTAGFAFVDTGHLHLPVFIAADSIFSLHIQYRFPADSLNGSQTVKIIIIRPADGNNLSLNFAYDTVFISLTRKTILLNLSAVMPPYSPSAGDQPFRFPIHINGDRLGKPELDNDTLRLVFSNKLLIPVGIDRTGSLTESTATNGIPAQPAPLWNEATSTYSIPCVGLHLSTDATKNTLLFTLLCSAYLTKDTAITITPFIGYIDQPCAYRVSKDSTTLSYANECGDQTIRGLLLASAVPIMVYPPVPNPVTEVAGAVSCSYYAAKALLLSWRLYDPLGVMEAEAMESSIFGGEGTFTIPLKQISISGAHYLEIAVRDLQTGAHTIISTKFTVIK